MKKTVLTLSMLALGISSCLAMASDKLPEASSENQQEQQANNHKLVDIYSKDDASSEVADTITQENQNNYNIFYCKQNNWCEVVEVNNGKVGWVSLDQLKQAQEEHAQQMFKEDAVKQLVNYTRLQDQKIVQLQTAIMQMQKEFSYALQQQQAQINQLQQTYYYQ